MIRFFLAVLLVTLGGMPALAQQPECQPKTPAAMLSILHPIMKTHTLPPYPPLSVATNEAGTTLLEVLIGADGKVISDKTIKSSGSVRLDDAAAEHVKKTWLWSPSLPPSCKQVLTRVSITWDLRDAPNAADPHNATLATIIATKTEYPPAALQKLEQGYTVVGFAISPAGEVGESQLLNSSSFADLDGKAMDVVRARHWTPATMDGQPVTTVMQVIVEWTIDGNAPPTPWGPGAVAGSK